MLTKSDISIYAFGQLYSIDMFEENKFYDTFLAFILKLIKSSQNENMFAIFG